MILFHSGKTFYQALNRIYFPSNDKSDRYALKHIELRQLESSLTALTSYGQGGAWFRRYVEGVGLTGINVLFRPTRIEDDLNILKLLKKEEYSNSPLAIEQDESSLAIISVIELEGSQIKKEGARNHYPLFDSQGIEEEEEDIGFGCPQFNETRIAEIEGKTFDNLIRDSYNFGSDKYDAYNPFYVITELNKLRVLSTCYSRATLLNRDANAIVDVESSVFGFNAAYLYFLLDLGEEGSSVEILYDGEETVTFAGTKAKVTLPLFENETSYRAMSYCLTILDENRHSEVEEITGYPLKKVGQRVVHLSETHRRIEVQQGVDSQLRIDSEGTNLEVTKLRDTKRKKPDKSKIPIITEYASCLETEWVSLVVNYNYFLKCLGVAKNFLSRQEETITDALTLDLHGITLADQSKRYTLSLKTVQNNERETFSLLYMTTPTEELLDEANEEF